MTTFDPFDDLKYAVALQRELEDGLQGYWILRTGKVAHVITLLSEDDVYKLGTDVKLVETCRIRIDLSELDHEPRGFRLVLESQVMNLLNDLVEHFKRMPASVPPQAVLCPRVHLRREAFYVDVWLWLKHADFLSANTKETEHE